MFVRTIAAVGLLAVVGACGANPADRALTGGAIGTAAGAAAGQVIGGDPWTGALAGGAAGAAAGALTDQSTIDLGDPIWR